MTARFRHPILPALLAILAACSEGPTGPQTERAVDRVEVAPAPASLLVGESVALQATPRDRSGAPLAGRTVSWTSSDTLVATVSGAGLVRARAEGSVVIRATSEGKSGQVALSVQPLPVAWVEITPGGEIILLEGHSRQLGVVARALPGDEVTGRPVVWSSSDTLVATVSAAGLLQARAAGSATITATVEGKAGTTTVRVPTQIARVELDRAELTLGAGDETQLTARALRSDGTPLERAFAWSSTDPSVAVVDAAGRVRGVGDGTTTVTATSEGRSASVRVTVGTWMERSLLAVGDSALPTTLYSMVQTRDGAERGVRFQVTAGRLRLLGAASRYELLLSGWLHVEGEAPVPASIVSEGAYLFNVWFGTPMLYPHGTSTSGPPHFQADSFPEDGSLVLKGRPTAGAPVVSMRFQWP